MGAIIFAVGTPPAGIIAWTVIGLIVGWTANRIMRGRAYGLLGDVVIGLIGSFFGGLGVISFFDGPLAFWGSIATAGVAACGLIVAVRAIRGRQRALRL